MKKRKPKAKPTSLQPEVVKPTYSSRRPLEILDIPEGETFSHEKNANRIKREETIDKYVMIFKAALDEGMDKREIKKLLGLRDDLFDKIEKIVINEDGQTEIVKATPYRFYEYIRRQEKCVRDLEYFTNKVDDEISMYHRMYELYLKGEIDKPPTKPNTSAAIMAIKARSDILDKMIKTGQDLGIIEKRAKEIRVSGNLNLAALPTEELKSLLSKKMKELNLLVEEEKLPSVYQKMLPGNVDEK